MSENRISYGDYSEVSAKQVGEAIEGLPSSTAIARVVGVTAGSAGEYRDTLHDVLNVLGQQVQTLSAGVRTFSENAVAAIGAIRAADDDAVRRSRDNFVELNGQVALKTTSNGFPKNQNETTNTSNTSGNGGRKFSN